MLASLPPGEPDGLLFKTHFINRLPLDIRNHVMAGGFTLSSREMAAVADNLWFARNSRQRGNRHHPVAAEVPEDTEELEEEVAQLNVQPKRPQPKKKAAKGGKSQGFPGSPHLHVVGKRVGSEVAAAAAAPKGTLGRLLYLVDVDNSKRYLVDSGSAFSILPHKSSAEPTGPWLMTADGKPLHCWAAARALSAPGRGSSPGPSCWHPWHFPY